ncbi:FkbM family methyltransferase [uncultured Tateyamaria sp.]|uniref:FkbM family methyltransferase n=1 Tax=uncultured Tateyamaria sp. TaxID=455651 RepID=UPI00260CF215|nr:FkbM family methyltransferase [uncultured Tateyamaria sp.]
MAKDFDMPRAAENKYGRYHIPEGLEDRLTCRTVLSGGVHHPDTVTFMRDNAGTGDIIHVGTFFGDFLPGLSSAMAPKAKIWAFEPHSENHDATAKTIELNGINNAQLRNVAVSDRETSVLLKSHDPLGKSLGGNAQVVPQKGAGVEVVKSVMLDFAVPRWRNVSILQIDVEGHEKQVLRGAFHLIRRCRPILVVDDFYDFKWVQNTFPGFRYDQLGKVHSSVVYAAPNPDIKI